MAAACFFLILACEAPSPTVSEPSPTRDASLPAAGALVEVEATAEAPEPLIVVDGEIHEGTLALLEPGDIERVEVLKGPAARAAYGEAGADGVVRITTKARAEREGPVEPGEVSGPVRVRIRPSTGAVRTEPLPPAAPAGVLEELRLTAREGALVFVDDVEAPDGVPSSLAPDQIDRVEVIKGEAAQAVYGPRAADGVILITTKASAPPGGG